MAYAQGISKCSVEEVSLKDHVYMVINNIKNLDHELNRQKQEHAKNHDLGPFKTTCFSKILLNGHWTVVTPPNYLYILGQLKKKDQIYVVINKI